MLQSFKSTVELDKFSRVDIIGGALLRAWTYLFSHLKHYLSKVLHKTYHCLCFLYVGDGVRSAFQCA